MWRSSRGDRTIRQRASPDTSIITQTVRFTRVYVYLEKRWEIVPPRKRRR